jgi:CRISPR-associated protein Cmr2
MSSHLLALSVGPVQEFIAAARRTRDLWFGSHLLSEISKAVARSVRMDGGELIFPSPNGDDELEPDTVLNVANIIVARLEGGDPRAVAQNAKCAAQARWRKFADDVFNDPNVRQAIRANIWNEQVDDVVEYYAAWVPLEEKDYKNARERVMRLLVARKNCRDFRPAIGHAGVPKSSLDGLRESVLTEDRGRWGEQTKRALRVRDGEQLDVVGVVKRAAAGHRPYPSVSRIAADPWLRGLELADRQALGSACERLPDDVLHRLRGKLGARYADFPYEGTALYRSRHHEFREEVGIEENDERLKALASALKECIKTYGEPDPYLAILVADGDRMGAAIRQLTCKGDNQKLSKALSRFAGEADRIVDDHRGVLVYAGGDDVFAFLPVDQCLPCARKLHDTYGTMLREWSKTSGQELTLSVGIAIAHFLENLEDLREYGHDAEKHAKNPRSEDGSQTRRNGLAVHLHKRGGAPISVRANWSDNLDTQLRELAEWLKNDLLPTRLANDLHAISREYDAWSDSDTLAQAIQKDALRIASKKRPGASGVIGRVKDTIRMRVSNAATLRRFANELLVARQIASVMRQANRS